VIKITVSKINQRWLRRMCIAFTFPFLWLALLLQSVGLVALKTACYPFTAIFMHTYDLCEATANLWKSGKEQWK
jgi:hypothetical protein